MTKQNNIDSWDDFEEQSFVEKYKFYLGIAAVAVGSIPLYFMAKSDPVGDVYADYIRNDLDSAIAGAEKIINAPDSDADDVHMILSVLFRIYTDTDAKNPAKAVQYGERYFKLGKTDVIARDMLAHLSEINAGMQKKAPYLEFLAKKGDDAAKVMLVDFYISENNRHANRKAMEMLKLLPQTSDVKMKQAKIMLNREGGEYNLRAAHILIEEASRMGDPEGAAYLALKKLEDSKRDKRGASELVREFTFLARRALEGGYTGTKAQEIVNIIELGRYDVPRDPSFAEAYQELLMGKQSTEDN